MATTNLDSIRTHIISMICNETSEKVLNDVKFLLTENDIPPMGGYSAETLKNAVLRSREDIRDGKVITVEELRAKHPRG
ncbi:MAG: hypothetical protein FWD60_07755 [Candidatus Azobacteroides sp.]|nr:hypothetical protein [Candidatus Azobacteroides sp.]